MRVLLRINVCCETGLWCVGSHLKYLRSILDTKCFEHFPVIFPPLVERRSNHRTTVIGGRPTSNQTVIGGSNNENKKIKSCSEAKYVAIIIPRNML